MQRGTIPIWKYDKVRQISIKVVETSISCECLPLLKIQ